VAAPDIPADWRPERERVTGGPPDATLPPGALVMGILNATPDSFSNGGQHAQADDAIAAGRRMLAAGATILDIGGESTRPGAQPLPPGEEWRRVGPVIAGLRGAGGLISVDTRHAEVMARALEAGADVINDVSALAHDPDAAPMLARHTTPVILMHMRGTPETMNALAVYDDVAVDVVRELGARVAIAEDAGIARDRILVDPGFGFAKDAAQNITLLRRLPILANLGCRVLVGTSRKRFIGQITGVARADDRDPGTLAATLPGLDLPGALLRVHAVEPMIQALRVWQALHPSGRQATKQGVSPPSLQDRSTS
ncbi:dihydropteroate synthase, partial [Ameyamaea chiangmaiensis]